MSKARKENNSHLKNANSNHNSIYLPDKTVSKSKINICIIVLIYDFIRFI